MENYIKVLDTNTADKVAAGEVVERPASVVKELVENAIDAGSTNIEIETENGGMSLIRVSDNGRGMSPADAELSVRRHATSKIRTIEDLFQVRSMGFRGEALPSIAAVTKFTLASRNSAADFATTVLLTGGLDLQIDNCGRAIGTTVSARELFFNVPARRKFIKTDSTENTHIVNMLIKAAVANTAVAIKYKHNGKLILNSPGNGKLFDTIAAVYGKEVATQLMEVNYTTDGIAVHGYIAKPGIVRSNRSWQTFCVNNRVITNKMLFRALDNAYHSLLPKHGYCFAVILIETDPAVIDINVHPQKQEIKFSDEQSVYSAVYKAISLALTTSSVTLNSVPERQFFSGTATVPNRYSQKPLVELEPIRDAMHNIVVCAPDVQPSQLYVAVEKTNEVTAANESVASKDTSNIDIYGCFENTFILANIDNNLLLIDQHAAHERIIYDKLADSAGRIASQQLLIDEFVDLSTQECALAIQHALEFFELGYSIELASPTSIRISEVPIDMNGNVAVEIFLVALKYLQQHHKLNHGQLRHEFLQIAACRAAIKAGDKLDEKAMHDLLRQLMQTKLPYTCPHGRPTVISFSHSDLYKMFKRL
ncbi:MAG: DNA mismatch repair endonuclease MutL [Negativicutes bacterium]|jgi:DNA mismatch repair protein MutL